MDYLRTAMRLVPLILSAITAVEKLTTGMKGPQKQDAAIEMVGDMVPLVEGMVGTEFIDEEEVKDAMRTVIDAIVKLMNVVREVAAKRK